MCVLASEAVRQNDYLKVTPRRSLSPSVAYIKFTLIECQRPQPALLKH